VAVSSAVLTCAPGEDAVARPGRVARLGAALRGPHLWLWVLALAAVAPQTWHAITGQGDVLVDLHVYRQAGLSLLHHKPVYAEYVNTQFSLLPFTYPPPAAVLAVPLAALPLRADGLLWCLAVYAVLAWTLRLLLVPVSARLRAQHPRLEPLLLPAAFVGSAFLLPVHQQIKLGQVGVFLLALVLLDLLTPRTGRWRGVLVGVATAIKLTPGVYTVALLCARRWRAAVMSVLGFLGVVAITYAVAPGTSTAYWTDQIFHSDRLGNNASPANQSLRGMLLRTGMTGVPATLVLGVLCLVALVAGLYVSTAAWRRGDELLAVAVTGLLSCLLSPVSWTHHFVYVLPLLAWLARNQRWSAAVAVSYLWSFDWAAHYDRHVAQGGVSGALWQVVGSEFTLLTAVVVLGFAAGTWRTAHRPVRVPAAARAADPALV
jgi:alpha-1,2-mannosyltransferase